MRSRKLQRLIDEMNTRSEQWGCSETEDGNFWLHRFLQELGEYRGYRTHEKEDGTEWCETL